MKNFSLLFSALMICCQMQLFSQGCLPEGITFTTQEQIDSFQINFPNCTEIEGSVYITGPDIINLFGLQVVNSVGGDLEIYQTSSLINLSGLDNLTFIGGELHITLNEALLSLAGLDNLTYIEGELVIAYNEILLSLTGMENLFSVGTHFDINNNNALTDLTGLNNLHSVGGYFDIIGNNNLEGLTGLEAVTSLNHLSLQHNEALISLLALQNLDSVPGVLRIGDNDALISLQGLHHITYIGGDFLVYENDALTDFGGLDNLSSIGDCVGIWGNDLMTSLNGLEALTAIGGELTIGYWHQYPYSDYGNLSLTSLTGLHNLTSIGGYLRIEDNDKLTSLSGIDNIAANSIDSLYIHHNDSLSMCEVSSVCDYLANPSGTIEIYDNEAGCNSPEEVEEACLTTIEEIETGNGIKIIPNPSNDKINISSSAITGVTHLAIFNANGEKVVEKQLTDTETQIDISALPRGVYFVRVQDEKIVEVGKIIKQ